MNIDDIKNDFPEMPDEIRDRVNSEVMRMLEKADDVSKKHKATGHFKRYIAGFAAAVATLALCVTVPRMFGRKNFSDKKIAD